MKDPARAAPTECAARSGCATVARLLGGNPAGSATHMTSWLLIEHPGAWSADAVDNALAAVFDEGRLTALRAAGMRPLLIRRHGRQPTGGGPITVFVAAGWPGTRWLEQLEVADLQAVADLNLEAVAEGRPGHGHDVNGPLFLVCTHGAKDMCCAVLGRPVAKALAKDYPDRVWEVSHVGGDRWAGNLLVVPDGFLHGQLAPTEAALVAKSAVVGQVQPDHLRGRTSAVTGFDQAAEIAVRKYTGLCGIDEVRAIDSRHGTDATSRRVVVAAGDRRFEVLVRHQTNVASDENRCTGHLALAEYSPAEVNPVDGT